MNAPSPVPAFQRWLQTHRRHPLLREALTHPSTGRKPDYQRLEFLGDAALYLASARVLLELFPQADEAELTRRRAEVVRTEALAAASRVLGLPSLLSLSRMAARQRLWERPRTQAEVMEAVTGALYLLHGVRAVQRLVQRLFFPEAPWPRPSPWGRLSVDEVPGPMSPPEEWRRWLARHPHPLLDRALVHPSVARERGEEDNQRLEFLGDAVLQLATADLLLARYPECREGVLSPVRGALVADAHLRRVAEELGLKVRLGSHIPSGERERALPSARADAVEATVGALYLVAGKAVCWRLVEDLFLPLAEEMVRDGRVVDAKTRLQEQVQAAGGRVGYELVRAEGPPHRRRYTVRVTVDGRPLGEGEGSSRKEAEQEAARQALAHLGHRSPAT